VTVEQTADGIDVLITNTGTVPATGGSGRGLAGLRERVGTVGGSFEAGPVDGGWRVSVRVPS
jgi:signal transduction histidine kinase